MNKTFNVTIEKTHEFQASVASMLVRSDSSYKGNIEFISDLQNIIARNDDYADVFETNSRWVYENNQWVNTDKEILINPLVVKQSEVSHEAHPNSIVKRDDIGNIRIVEPQYNNNATTKQYVDTKDTTNLASAKSYTDTKLATLGTASSKNTGTAVGDIPLIGSSGTIDRYIVPNANGGLLGTVAGIPFANATTKAGATYAQILIGDAGDAYAYYPIVDTAMSDSSVNLVQNKSVKAYVDGLVGDIETLLAGV